MVSRDAARTFLYRYKMTAQEARSLMPVDDYKLHLDKMIDKLNKQIKSEAKQNKDDTVFLVRVKNSKHFYKVHEDIRKYLNENDFTYIISTSGNIIKFDINWRKHDV